MTQQSHSWVYFTDKHTSKRYMHSSAQSSSMHSGQDMGQPKCPSIDEWIEKMWCTHAMEYCTAIKNEIVPLQPHG